MFCKGVSGQGWRWPILIPRTWQEMDEQHRRLFYRHSQRTHLLDRLAWGEGEVERNGSGPSPAANHCLTGSLGHKYLARSSSPYLCAFQNELNIARNVKHD